jgi:hypothetical protein
MMIAKNNRLPLALLLCICFYSNFANAATTYRLQSSGSEYWDLSYMSKAANGDETLNFVNSFGAAITDTRADALV